jgi:hypothetical protein
VCVYVWVCVCACVGGCGRYAYRTHVFASACVSVRA